MAEAQGLKHGCPPFLQEWSDTIAAAINENKPIPGVGISTSPSSAGTAINAGPPPTDPNSTLPGGGGSGDDNALPDYPETDGTYVLGVVITGGNPELQWIATDTCS